MKRYFALLLFFLGAVLCGAVKDEKMLVAGSGKTEREAIVNALTSALEQKYGMTISTAESTKMFSDVSFKAQNGTESQNRESQNFIKTDSQSWSKGKISGYRILFQGFDQNTQKYQVRLEVRFPGRYVVGNDPDNRRRMVVGVFYPDKVQFSIFGKVFQSAAWVQAFTDSLNTSLTQTRKFTMLDRKFDDQVNRELARVTAPNAAKEDLARLGQKLATDYLVVGTVSFNNIAAPGVNPYTGQTLPLAPANFVTVHYRVLLAATGQLKWADDISLDITEFANSFYSGSLTESAKVAAADVCDGMMDNILPFEITAFAPDGSVVIGEGGKSLAKGEFLSVYALGEDVKDTRTGEIIDAMEMRVGMVKVMRVSAKLSYAMIVQGDRKNMPVGSRLRRDEFAREASIRAQQAPAMPAAPTEIQATPSGGVVTPF